MQILAYTEKSSERIGKNSKRDDLRGVGLQAKEGHFHVSLYTLLYFIDVNGDPEFF